MRGKSTIHKLTTILIMTVQKLKAQYNFIGPVSSGKVNFRPIGEGPLAEFFSICQSATECRVMDKQTDVWVDAKLNEAFIYSAQLVKKTFVTGFTSKVLDLSAWKAAGDKPVERDTNPKKILKCPFTKGYRWICLNGDTGAYFTYDIQKEASETNFEPALAAKFGLLNNGDCAIVVENKTLFCAKIGPDTKKIIQLDQANAGGLANYAGNLTVPDKPVGATAHEGIIGVFSVDTVKMRIGNYSTGAALFAWDKAETADAIKSVADMKWGMMIITNNDKTDIVKIKDGTVLKTIKAQTSEFSEVEKSIYFVDASKNNEDSYYNFTLPPIPENCKDYHYGIEKCLGCVDGSKLLANGSCSKNATNTTTPGNFIPIKDYELDFEGRERGLAVMSFKNLTGLTNQDKANFIKNFTNDTNFTQKFVVRHAKDSSWNVSDFMRFEPMAESMAWEQGILPITVIHLRSMEYFMGSVGVLTHGNQANLTNNTNATNSTAPANTTTPTTPANSTAPASTPVTPAATPKKAATPASSSSSPASSSGSRRFLVDIFGGGQRALQTTPSPTNNVSLPPFWKPSDSIKTFFRVIFDIMKFIINLIQVYLIFIKPFSRLFRLDKWSSWFASSLQAMQIYLCLGGISGRFGGVIDAMKVEQLKSFQRNFFFDTEVNFSSDYQKISRAAILEKFEKAKYTPSPLQETFWEFLILMASILFQGIGTIAPDFYPIASSFRKGATISFMVPLVLASTGCIVTLIKTGLSNIFGVLSLITSIFLLFYFIAELIALIRPCEGMESQKMSEAQRLDYKNRLLREGSYRCYDIDSLNNFNRQRPLNFYEYLIHLLIPIFLFSFLFTGVGSILSILALMIPKLILVLTQINNRNERLKRNGWGQDVGKEVNDIKALKMVDYILKILALMTLLLFSTLLVYSNLAWTQIFTILGLLYYLSDYLVLIFTFIKRLLGWGDAIGRTKKIVREIEYRERDVDRSEMQRSRYDDRGMDPPQSTDRRIVDRSRPSSPRDVPSRGPGDGAPVRRLPPMRRPDGPVSPRYDSRGPDVRRSRLN